MADENTIDYPALCEELSARVTELEAALAEEQDKNAVLVQQVVEAEDNIANREATLGLLNRMRTRKTVVTEVAVPAAKPLRNRATGMYTIIGFIAGILGSLVVGIALHFLTRK